MTDYAKIFKNAKPHIEPFDPVKHGAIAECIAKRRIAIAYLFPLTVPELINATAETLLSSGINAFENLDELEAVIINVL